ncbi:unnamed protein product [Acanthoscelides obtectus]|uniref:39S ribosomal protein L28, mitochondrial n=1 Tax=Acanthoscelides obtectus TaxID=200917 RepID=A0A9P0NS30_ACAOB|nr:unnamed protein product [Acanthoscelides obtectus]CAK1649989.1 39S ribosomal protein L28, mitochondrial [Acanthoscelides obtectus]
MASKSVKALGLARKSLTALETGLATRLPEAYKKFYKEWKLTEPTAVHYIPETGKWKRNDITGEVFPVQNVPLPVIYPPEANNHIWGGDGVIQGFQSRASDVRRVPHFWVPVLKRTVVYSEVLDKYLSVIVTERAISLINSNYGFDHYLLKTPACDLKGLLPLRLKRKILQELQKGCPSYADKPEKQSEVLHRFENYLSAYTAEEIEWYGYSLHEALRILKQRIEEEERSKVVPLKHMYRAQLIEKLKAASLSEMVDNKAEEISSGESGSWLQKINPFGKKRET